MSSLWDEFARKIHAGEIKVEEMVELVEFLREFDAVNKDVIFKTLLIRLQVFGYGFTTYSDFEDYLKGKGVQKHTLNSFIGLLHDFDHANEQVLMYSFTKDKNYWTKHRTFRNWMGTFKDGVWKYSRNLTKIRAERAGSAP